MAATRHVVAQMDYAATRTDSTLDRRPELASKDAGRKPSAMVQTGRVCSPMQVSRFKYRQELGASQEAAEDPVLGLAEELPDADPRDAELTR